MALNIEKPDDLRTFLVSRGLVSADESIESEILTGGVSNRTVLIRADGREWVAKQALEKLRVEVDWFCNVDRIHREAETMRVLHGFAPKGSIPDMVLECPTEHVLVMEAVPSPHENWKEVLMRGNIDPAIVCQFGRLLGTIHRASHERLSEIPKPLLQKDFFEDLRLEPYYLYTAREVPGAAGFLKSLVVETRTRASSLVHGDYSPKNILVYGKHITLLDHEVGHVGDPAFDVGFALTHFLSKAHHLVEHRKSFHDAALHFWDSYREKNCMDAEFGARCVRHTLGCLIARVAGRSRLEYLSTEERTCQRTVVLHLMESDCAEVPLLIENFVHLIEVSTVS